VKEQSFSFRTLYTEFETIDIGLKLINLLEMLHDNNIIHTNFSPENIFLKEN
jgi:serine/threonine protein kinase